MKTDKVTRLEIIDHSKCFYCNGSGKVVGLEMCEYCSGAGFPGRMVVLWDKNKSVEALLQDNDRTLKIFITERKEVETHNLD